MIQVYPCGCNISKEFLWTRCCWRHKKMCEEYPQHTVMAAILVQKHPSKLDPYEDQLMIFETYAKLKKTDNGR